MYRNLLTKKFFRDHPVAEYSAPWILYNFLLHKDFEQKAYALVMGELVADTQRRERVYQERAMILAERNPQSIFQLLRKSIDVANRLFLVDNALEFEAELMPLVAEKLIRNNHDTFIENAVRLLAWSKEDYSASLRERYKEIRSPYVQSLVCVVSGLRGPEDIIPWMMERFYEMEKRYPKESHAQGPLLALIELNARFYTS